MFRFCSSLAVAIGLWSLTRPSHAEEERTPVEPPRALGAPRVELPESAEIGTQGLEIELFLIIEADGSVSAVALPKSYGQVIDEALRRSMRKLLFEPARRNGEAVRSRIPFRLTLGESAAAETSDERQEGFEPAVEAPEQRKTEVLPSEPPPAGGSLVEITITGSRVPEPRGRSVVATQSISREDIVRSGATNVGSALEAEPGVQVERSFRGTEVWLRGLDPEYTLILVDGQRLPGRVGGAIDLSRFSLENVEKIEIVRGPSSALYGSDAIGGTINILTRESQRPLEADAEARIATNNGSLGNLRVAGRLFETATIAVAAGHQHTDAYRSSLEDVQTLGSARTLDTAGTSIAFGDRRRKRLRLNVDYTKNRLEGTDLGTGGAIFDRTQLQEQAAVGALFTSRQKKWFLSTSAQYTQFREQYLNDQRNAIALDSYQDNREHQGIAGTTLAYSFSERQRTTLGSELLSQILDSERLSSTGFRARYASFAEHRWVAFVDQERALFTVTPGARYDLDSQFGSQLSPKLALRYDPYESWTLRASYGRGFRAPSFQELLLRFENPAVGYVVVGNPSLGAESSHSVDVSAEWRPERSMFLSVAGFRNDLSNMIGTVSETNPDDLGTLFTYENIARAWTMGLENQAIWSPHEWLALTVGYTLMETRDEALERPLSGRPKHRFTFRSFSKDSATGLSFMMRGSLSLDRSYFVDQPDGSTVVSVPPPLLQLDFRAAKEFSPAFELFLGATNLANAGDEFATLLPRQFYAGVAGHY